MAKGFDQHADTANLYSNMRRRKPHRQASLHLAELTSSFTRRLWQYRQTDILRAIRPTCTPLPSMGNPRHLTRAPIQEAIVHLAFDPVPDGSVGEAAALFERKHEVDAVDLWQTSFQVKFEPHQRPLAQHATGHAGKRIDIPQQRQVVQLYPGSFTASRLPPYETWGEMLGLALTGWADFSDHAGVKRVTQLSVRYLNVLLLPLPFTDFAEYLNSPPVIPQSLPQGLAGFLNRVVIPRGEDLAVVTQSFDGIVEAAGGQALRVAFDIEASTQCSLGVDEFVQITPMLERLRAYKNDVFFSFLTDKTLEMYE